MKKIAKALLFCLAAIIQFGRICLVLFCILLLLAVGVGFYIDEGLALFKAWLKRKYKQPL